MFRPLSLLATLVAPTLQISYRADGDFYGQARHASLPPHAPDMLAVRIRQLTARGLSPRQNRSLVGCPTLSFPPTCRFSSRRTSAGRQTERNYHLPNPARGQEIGLARANGGFCVELSQRHTRHTFFITSSRLCFGYQKHQGPFVSCGRQVMRVQAGSTRILSE